MSRYITVYYNGNGLLVNTEVARKLRLSNGQSISKEKFWQTIQANSTHEIAELNVLIEAKNTIESKSSKN